MDEGKTKPVEVWYLHHDDSTLFVEVRDGETRTLQVSPAKIRRFEVSQERSGGAWTGFKIGWVVGGFASTFALMADPEIDSSETAAAALLGFAFFGPLVGLVGSLIGSGVSNDRWVEVWERDRPDGGPGGGERPNGAGGSP